MKVVKASHKDLPYILPIYEEARAFMRENGNPDQWGNKRPEKREFEEYIDRGELYLLVEDDQEGKENSDCNKITGVFGLVEGDVPQYEKIWDYKDKKGAWINDLPYISLHILAGRRGKKGAFKEMLAYAFSVGNNLKIDTHEKNLPMRNALKKHGFSLCGVIKVLDGTDRLAYQKKI